MQPRKKPIKSFSPFLKCITQSIQLNLSVVSQVGVGSTAQVIFPRTQAAHGNSRLQYRKFLIHDMSVKIWSSSLRTDFFKCELWRLVDVWGMRIRLSLLFVFYRFSLLRCYLLVFQWRQRTLSILMERVTCDCNVFNYTSSPSSTLKLVFTRGDCERKT